MRPLSLALENVRVVGWFDHTFANGVTAIVAPNGRGKSTILDSIERALFSSGSSDLAPMLGPLADAMKIELVFAHGGETYRVRRTYRERSGRGSATLDLERKAGDGSWVSESRETAKATQGHLCELLGLSRRTFRCSSFIGQGDAGAFTEADPADRKAVLGEATDPRGVWAALLKLARDDLRETDLALTRAQATIDSLQERLSEKGSVEAAVATLEQREQEARARVTEDEQALEAAQKAQADNQARAERVARLRVEYETAKAEHERAVAALTVARDAAERLPQVQAHLEALRESAARVPALEAAAAAMWKDATSRVAALRERQTAQSHAATLTAAAGIAATAVTNAETQLRCSAKKLADLTAAAPDQHRCDRCDQTLGVEAREKALASLGIETKNRRERVQVLVAASEQAQQAAEAAGLAAEAVVIPDVPEFDPAELSNARTDAAQISGVEEQVRRLGEQALGIMDFALALSDATEAVLVAEQALAEASEGAQDDQTLRFPTASARNELKFRQVSLKEHVEALARARERLSQLEDAEQDLSELVQANDKTIAELGVYRNAERAFGRDGVPVFLIERITGTIEADANRLLALMPADGDVFTVELRTLGPKRDGDLKETFDIVVHSQNGARLYETYSGGEKGRLNLALRLALAMLLADRFGADLRFLGLDELPFLDLLGQEQLVEVVKSVASRFDVVLSIFHEERLAQAFDNVIQLVKQDGVSRILEAA